MSQTDYIILLKISQVAERLQISRTGAYRLCETGLLPCIRFGATVRVRPVDLENFISCHLHDATGISTGDAVQP